MRVRLFYFRILVPKMSTVQEGSEKSKWGWILFDWANSSYSLVISTTIFPTFFISATDPMISIGPGSTSNSSLYAYTISFAYLLVCCLSPVLSGIADYGGHRKFFMRLFTTLGSLCCMGLFFFNGMDTLWICLAFFAGAAVCHAASLVFYDSYLADLVPPSQSDQLSAKGYAFGYIGSVILLITNLMMIQKPEWFGFGPESIAKHIPIRFAFFAVGAWWLGFSQFSFAWLPRDRKVHGSSFSLMHGVNELRKAWRIIRSKKEVFFFLASFLFYSAGVQTVVYLASPFAQKELGFESAELILVILLLQVVAIGGALTFARIARWKNNVLSMKIMLLIWIVICVMAYSVTSKAMFYMVAALVGLVIGGIQSVSRSTFSKLIPHGHEDVTCFFSFYNVVYYVSIVLGSFMFGFVDQITGSMRYSVLSLILFFCLAFVLISQVKKEHLAQ